MYHQYLTGDQAAGDQLMIRYADALTAYLDGFLHNAQDAEDLMLDCFTVILVNKPSIREGNFRAYLFKVARNKANRLWKMRLRQPEFSMDEEINPLKEERTISMTCSTQELKGVHKKRGVGVIEP